MTIFNRNICFMLFIAISLLSTATIVMWLPLLKNESEVGLSLKQIAPAVSEKAFYAGDELTISFTCDNTSVDRWMVHVTATANPDNIGSMTMKIDGVGEKTVRTGMFNKISGTYSIPLYDEMSLNGLGKVVLHINLKGGNKREPLIYLAEMAKNKTVVYQVALQPEKGHSVVMPKNAVYPRPLLEYKPSGESKIN